MKPKKLTKAQQNLLDDLRKDRAVIRRYKTNGMWGRPWLGTTQLFTSTVSALVDAGFLDYEDEQIGKDTTTRTYKLKEPADAS